MATALVLHHVADESFVQGSLSPILPILGFDRVRLDIGDRVELPAVDVVLIVISASALPDQGFIKQETAALESRCRMVPIVLDVAVIGDLPKELAMLPAVHLKPDGGKPLFEQLKALLQPVARAATTKKPAFATAEGGRRAKPAAGGREWNGPAFSSLLKQAVDTYDSFGSAELVESFAAHVGAAGSYPASDASTDLKVLRSKRQFHMLCRYASALVEAGPTPPIVRRQFGQALIEQKNYERALSVLQSIVRECKPTDDEAIEAQGLIGRLFKQRYVDGNRDRDEELLKQAIDAYRKAARNAPNNYWPAINDVSCTLRANRDGFSWADAKDAQTRAKAIVKGLDLLWKEKQPQAWDQASYVEAFVALDDFERAEHALSDYLSNRGTDSFEVSSTYRQFVEVLQLDHDQRGRRIVDRLWNAVDEHRSGGAFSDFEKWPAEMLVRVSDENWQPLRIPDLKEKGRLGAVVSVEGSKATVQALYRDSMVITVDPGRPVEDVKECKRSVPYIGVAKSYTRGTETYEESGDHALIAVIDNGIDVLHEAFLDAAKHSRIVAIWDQRDVNGPPPSEAGYDASLNYGRFYDRNTIAEIIATGTVPAKLGRNFNDQDPNFGHGTHVASIAAGRATAAFGGGVAPDAKLAVVIHKTGEPVGYSNALLGALRFIDQLADKETLPVVVNVSLGMNAGAHDGKSPLEVAFETFSSGGAKPGRVVVKSAGNEGEADCHVEAFVGQAKNGRIRWQRFPNSFPWADDIELWWPGVNEYTFTLESPNQSQSATVHLGQRKFEGVLQDTGVRMVLSERVRDNGMNRLKVRIGGDMSIVPDGIWSLIIHAPVIGNASLPIHAWIERREGVPSRFLQSSPRMTLSVPATAQSVIAVGSIALGKTDADVEVDPSSSRGPTRDNRDKPDLSAPGVNIFAAKSGSVSDAVAMSGTSMAAPFVTGAVALALSRVHRAGIDPPAANELIAVLTQKASGYQGQADPLTGFGTLNVPAFLNAFSIEPPDED